MAIQLTRQELFLDVNIDLKYLYQEKFVVVTFHNKTLMTCNINARPWINPWFKQTMGLFSIVVIIIIIVIIL